MKSLAQCLALLLGSLTAPLWADPASDTRALVQSLGIDQLLQLEASGTAQAQFESALQQGHNADYVAAHWALNADNLTALQKACHQTAAENLAPALNTYAEQLLERPPLQRRLALAQALAAASRSAEQAAQVYVGWERANYTGEGSLDWREVYALRLADYRDQLNTWYLYCGRQATDETWQALIAAYKSAAVQRVLDKVEGSIQQIYPLLEEGDTP